MNNIIIKSLVLLSVFTVFLSGCNNILEEKGSSSLEVDQPNKDGSVTQKESNLKMANNISISFSLEKAQISLNEPIFLNFVLQNNSEQNVNLDLGQDLKEGFKFTVKFPDGSELMLPQLSHQGIARRGNITIKPDQTYTQKLLLNQWTEFNVPGKYILKGHLANPRTAKISEFTFDSNFTVDINITPRNPKKLEDVSDALAQSILETDSHEKKSEAALALSYVKDAVAVPYLEKVLTSDKMVKPIIMKGLARIGNKESVQILIDVIKNNPNSEDALLARSALQRIENKSSDADTKRLIREILSEK
jgi:hypothetical protein